MPRAARVTRRPARAPKEVRGKADPVEPVLRWLAENRATQVKAVWTKLPEA